MNWPMAKRVLIAAFLFLDIFLAYRSWGEPVQYEGQFLVATEEQIREAQEQLARAGITLATQIPRKTEPMAFLEVKRRDISEEQVVRAFFGDERPLRRREKEPAGATVFSMPKAELTFADNGTVTYHRLTPPPAPGPETRPGTMEASGARQAAEAFITTHGGFPPDARFDYVARSPDEDSFEVHYHREFQGKPFFGGHLVAVVAADGLRSLEMTWLEPIGYNGEKKAVIPPTEALLRLAGYLRSKGAKEPKNVVFEAIAAGYFTRAWDAERWEAAPVWRVRLADGEVYYVSAYTGELVLEGKEWQGRTAP